MRRTALLGLLMLSACGARTGTLSREPRDAGTDGALRDASPPMDAPPTDANRDGGADVGTDVGLDVGLDTSPDRGCIGLPDGCGDVEICDGADSDCDGRVDEGCDCEPGSVQDCFPGPPGRRSVGACTDGTQTCEGTRSWGSCLGGIGPTRDRCDGRDNACDGCSEMRDCPISCPSPGDPRTPTAVPFTDYRLHGGDFYPGLARGWRWRVTGGPCDTLAPRLVSFDLRGTTSEDAVFTPRLSGDYTVTMEVVTVEGTMFSCSWVVHVVGPGLRIEMCYPESETQDLDLAVHRPGSMANWYPRGGTAQDITAEACSWANCEAMVRGADFRRADWGYPSSPLTECENGPAGDGWRALGFCANPRLDIDNNLSEGIGLPENVNIDFPRDGETFRVMVQNWTGTIARPVVNVYCSGTRVATYGAAPDQVPGFEGRVGSESVGAMWRVVDITTHVGADGTLTCDTQALHRPPATTGYFTTVDDPRY